MKLLAFGAIGSVGRELVEQALEQGHSVTAFVRDPAKLGIAHPELQVFQGDVLDPASVEAAVRGQQAVLCALGAGRKGVVRSDGTRNIIDDHVIQEDHIKGSQLDWTIVRAGAFTDGDRTGQYRYGFPGSDRTTALKISRADVADFMLRQLGDRTFRHQTPGLSY